MIKYTHLLTICLIHFSAYGIIPQHDVALDSYLRFGAASQFAPVGFLKTRNGNCTATLIDPYTILTSAHCLESLKIHENLDDYFFSVPTFGDHIRAITGARVPFPSSNRSFYDGFVEHDIAVAYLREPIIDIKPAILYKQPLLEGRNEEVEFAGFGNNDISPFPVKLAGKSGLKQHGRGFVAGYFEYLNSPGNIPNAMLASGDSGTGIMIQQRGFTRHVIGVATSTTEDVARAFNGGPPYGAGWKATTIYPHLTFLNNAMALREVESMGATLIWSNFQNWWDLKSKSTSEQEINNFDKQDAHGTLVRRFHAVIKDDVTLDSSVRVSKVSVRGEGVLRILKQELKADTMSVNNGVLRFLISAQQSGHIVAKKSLSFNHAIIDVRVVSLPPSLTLRNDFNTPHRFYDFLFGALESSAVSFFGLPSLLNPRASQWTLCSSKEIIGKPIIHIRNVPQGYEAWSEVTSTAVVIRMRKRA